MAEDRPLGGGGGYKINWDEIDENTNPFGLGSGFGGTKLASSPPARPAAAQQPSTSEPAAQPSPSHKDQPTKKAPPPAPPTRSPSTTVSSAVAEPPTEVKKPTQKAPSKLKSPVPPAMTSAPPADMSHNGNGMLQFFHVTYFILLAWSEILNYDYYIRTLCLKAVVTLKGFTHFCVQSILY